MAEILLFGGTIEGRILAEYLNAGQINTYVCVATDYGERLLPNGAYIRSSAKRLDKEEIEGLIRDNQFDLVLDATHPFAVLVSENIRRACEETEIEYIRVLRGTENSVNNTAIEDTYVWVESVREAVNYLEKTTGNILITTGSKELIEFTTLDHYEDRCYARVLSTLPVMEDCVKMGFQGSHLICMQGPFQKEMNLSLLKQVEAAYLVTKESGIAGGFMEKIEAAIEVQVIPIIIGRPKETEGVTVDGVKELLNSRYPIINKRKVTLLGVGMGNKKSLTLEGVDALNQCQLIIGAGRVVDGLADFQKEIYVTNRNEEIVNFIKEHEEFPDIVVAFSGDIGFYSGAKRLRPYLQEFEIHNICGISSPVYFLSKLGIPWEEVTLLSLHGRNSNLIEEVKHSNKVFALLGGEKCICDICRELIEQGLEQVQVTVGENLSYENECITVGTPRELIGRSFDTLAVILIENSSTGNVKESEDVLNENRGKVERKSLSSLEFTSARKSQTRGLKNDENLDTVVTHGIPDEAFIRGDIPMTKCEVRSISLSKLRLSKTSIVYDVGAGTGSVSIEAALLAKRGRVYAIEKKAEGINLIRENQQRFGVENLEIIQGEASECIESLPSPTHVFIGGTSGQLDRILEIIFKKNPKARIVLNVIALESLAQAVQLLKKLPVKDVEIVQAAISKGKEVGSYNLMMGQNPVYIISFSGQENKNHEN